jgi:COMPASS component BRE2
VTKLARKSPSFVRSNTVVPVGSGDVVGLYISLRALCPASKREPHDPAHVKRERIAIEFKGQEYIERLWANPNAPPSHSTRIKSRLLRQWVMPGHSLPRAVRLPSAARMAQAKCRTTREGTLEHKESHFYDGSLGYFPPISLFNGARIRLNPGPDFASLPPDIDAIPGDDDDDPPLPDADAAASTRTWCSLCERYAEFMGEQWTLDKFEENPARVKAAQCAEHSGRSGKED